MQKSFYTYLTKRAIPKVSALFGSFSLISLAPPYYGIAVCACMHVCSLAHVGASMLS